MSTHERLMRKNDHSFRPKIDSNSNLIVLSKGLTKKNRLEMLQQKSRKVFYVIILGKSHKSP